MGDGVRIPREAYEGLIAEDLRWLKAQPRSLERDHIEAVLRASADLIYRPAGIESGKEVQLRALASGWEGQAKVCRDKAKESRPRFEATALEWDNSAKVLEGFASAIFAIVGRE